MLCRMLGASGVAGKPESYFHRPDPVSWAEPLGIDTAGMASGAMMRAICAAVRDAGRGGTDCFGLRVQGHSLAFFQEQLALAWPELDSTGMRLEAAFGTLRFIFLWRRDLLAQAISRVKAEQTGLWHQAADGSEIERTAPPAPPRYDVERITSAIADLRTWQAAWERFFAEEDLDPFSLCYEDIAADPAGALRRVLAFLEIAPDREISADTGRLSDAVSRDWHARYLAETGQSASAFIV